MLIYIYYECRYSAFSWLYMCYAVLKSLKECVLNFLIAQCKVCECRQLQRCHTRPLPPGTLHIQICSRRQLCDCQLPHL